MKMDNNVDANGDDTSPPNGVENNSARQSVVDALNEILDQFANRLSSNTLPPTSTTVNGHSDNVTPPSSQSTASSQFSDILQQVSRTATDLGVVEGIDAASPLGRSLQRKFTELEEISHRLKTRLNQVVCDSDILLSPDVDTDQNIIDVDLERDLNTDSHAEDLTPQEFYQLVQSHIQSGPPECSSSDNSDKSDVSK